MVAEQNKDKGITFFAMQTSCTTRYAEYLHKSIDSLLKNMEIILTALPSLIDSKDVEIRTKQNAGFILDIVKNPCFIARLILANKVYWHVSTMEKEAQSGCFGAFEYVDITATLKEVLEKDLRRADTSALDVIASGYFRHEFSLRKGKHSFMVNLCDGQQTNLAQECEEKIQEVASEYESWVESIINRFDSYIELPQLLHCATKIFNISGNIPFSERLQNLRLLLSTMNSEFQHCSENNCTIETCHCLAGELERFLTDVKERVQIADDDPLVTTNLKDGEVTCYHYSKIFAIYLADTNQSLRQQLNITNVLRAVELVQLLKASQSATERAFSVVSNVVRGRYECNYRNRLKVKCDKLDDDDYDDYGSFVEAHDYIYFRDVRSHRM